MDLIATCARHFEQYAADELQTLLGILGDDKATASATGISGVIVSETSLGADSAVSQLRARLDEEPWEFRYIMRVIPVHATCASQAAEIAKAAEGLADRMGSDDTYRITLKKRNSGESGSQIISDIADRIPNRVCLENPDWIILVEVLGNRTGVAVIRPDGILRVMTEKMDASTQDDGALD